MPDPNQNQQQNPTTGVPFSPQTDLPPLPPEFQNLDTNQAATPQNPPEESGTAAPPTPTFSSVATSSPKKKFGTGRIIATILGVFFLLGGVQAGLYLTRQQQNLSSLAVCNNGCYQTDPMSGARIWIADEEGLQSYRSQLADNDSRAQVIDEMNRVEQQASCPSYGPCQCGTYTGGDGCTYCNTECGNGTAGTGGAQSFSYECIEGYYGCNVGCCGVGGTPTEGKRYYQDPNVVWSSSTGPVTEQEKANYTAALKTNGLQVNDNGTVVLTTNSQVEYFLAHNSKVSNYCYPGGTLDTSKCRIVTGGYLYIGGSRAGSDCAPELTGGADWCQVIGGEKATCESLGLIRCICNNSVGVIGSSGQSCDNLCGGTNNVCESCTTNESTTTTTTTSTASYQCQRIKAYDSEWTLLDNDGLSKLKAGDVVRFGIIFVVDGTADKARFTINGTLRPEVTAVKPGTTTEFYDEYTIPEGVTSFNVTGQIHSTTIGWF